MHTMLPPFDPWLSGIVAADVSVATRANAAELAARQSKRLASLLVSAARGSKLYGSLLKGRDAARVSLTELPIMRKADLMRAFDNWVTDPCIRLDQARRFTADPSRIADPFLDRYVVWESSGSRGEPGIFVQDANAMSVYDALEALRRPRLRSLWGFLDPWCLSERVAFVGAIGGHFASNVSTERLRRLNPVLAQNLHRVSFLQPVDRLVAQLQHIAPAVVATYPSGAALLAEEQLAGRLCLKAKEIRTGGETLSPGARELVQRAFDCPVVNSYGASEFLPLAFECELGHLHFNSDWAILEPVDEQGHAVPAGRVSSTTLLTNLANKVQPLIRYDLGDRIKFVPTACPCGLCLPVIEIQGRSDDTLRLANDGTRAVTVLPLAVSTVLEEEAGLFDFQLVQTGPCELLLRTGMQGLAADRALKRAVHALTMFLNEQGVTRVVIHCRSGEPGRQGHSGKVQRIVATADTTTATRPPHG